VSPDAELVEGHAEHDDLEWDEEDREGKSRLGLLAEGAEVRARQHGHVAPPAAPALHRIDLVGRVDGVEIGHGNNGRHEGHDGRDKGRGREDDGSVSELQS